jgi:hypothetical protein
MSPSAEQPAISWKRNSVNALPPGRAYWVVVCMIFLAAGGLRIALSLVNREANDDHYEVVKLILEGRSGLTMADCHECFHPKLFYYVCAGAVRFLDLTSQSSRIVAGQLLNTLAGLGTLALVFGCLHRTSFASRWRLWAFALIALNPRLIAINGQLSNDSLAILFATATIVLTLHLLKSPALGLSALSLGVSVQLALACALMTKGTTWVVAIAMLIVFMVRAVLDGCQRTSWLFVALFVATALNGWVSIELAGYDFEHYDRYANMGRGHELYLWDPTDVGRPGVRSIVDGYLTFRLLGLLHDPQITNGNHIQQTHRTSVWTQLYARANFAQFEQHPASWLTTDSKLMWLARFSFVLGLLPLLFLLVGLVVCSLRSIVAWRGWGVPEQNYASLFSTLICIGYIAFIVKFTADYRDFAAMKLIYVLPGVVAFGLALLEGMQVTTQRLSSVKWIEPLVHICLACLTGLYVAGIVALVRQLALTDQ